MGTVEHEIDFQFQKYTISIKRIKVNKYYIIFIIK